MNIRETKIQTLVLLAVLGSAISWAMAVTWPTLVGHEIQISYYSSTTMGLFAIVLLFWTLLTRRKLQSGAWFSIHNSMVTARSAALAMASSRVCSFAFGFYLALSIYNKVAVNTSVGSSRFQLSLLASLASFACVSISIWLERICKLPKETKR